MVWSNWIYCRSKNTILIVDDYTSLQEYGVAGEEKHILFLWSTEQLLTSIRFNTLLDQFTDVKRKYDNYKVYLAIYGLRNHYK